MQRRPDLVIFNAPGRKRLSKEVAEAERKAGVPGEERGGGGGKSLSAQGRGRPHPGDKPMGSKLRRGDAGEAGRLQTGGRQPETSRKMDPRL